MKFLETIQGKTQSVPPIWFMRQAGRYHNHYQNLRKQYSFTQLCKQPELAAETAMGPIRDFDFDAAILFSDILFPLESLGMGLSYEDGPPKLGFSLDESTIGRLGDVEAACETLNFQGQGVKATRAVLPKEKALIGFVGGPWTLFVYATEGGHSGSLIKSKKNLYSLYQTFCEKMIPLLCYTINEQIQNGADIVMIFDTAAGELNPELFTRFISPSVEKILNKFPGKIGYYGKSLTPAHLKAPLYQNAGLLGFGIDHRFDMATQLVQPRKGFLQGNFDQALLHLPADTFESELRKYLEPMTRLSPEQRRGWIAGLGHGVLPATPEANVKKYMEVVRKVFA